MRLEGPLVQTPGLGLGSRGAIEVTVGDARHRLGAGDCLALVLDRPTAYHNPTRKAARYAVVITTEPESRR